MQFGVGDGGTGSQLWRTPVGTGTDAAITVDPASGNLFVGLGGDEADAAIKGLSLLLTPHAGADGRLVWVCGNATPPAGARALVESTEYVNDVHEMYLTRDCR